MSTIKSSNEHLTLNADGSSKDIKFQANGVEKASISSAGAFTSTTIDATKLTGNLPAVNGSALTNLTAANLTGALPAISGAALTGVGVAGISSSADATAITIDSSEQVGIGTASPSSELHIAKSANGGNTELILENTYNAGSSTDETVQIQGRFGGIDASYIITGKEEDFSSEATRSSYMAFSTRWDGALAERFRITKNGSFHTLASTHSSGAKFGFGTDSPNGKVHIKYDGWNGSDGIEMQDMYGGSFGTIAIDFNRNGNRVGTLMTTLTATQYNTSSDYRLKENVDYTWDATTRLKQLKPARFNFIVDDTNTLVDGFIAHEVSSIVPEAVSGEKDAMIAEVLYVEGDELPEGKNVGDVKTAATINPQGIDQSKLVPLLVKTIQELEARITALEG